MPNLQNTKKIIADKLSFFSIFFLAAVFRLVNPNWDRGFHLHPDERFLTMVGNSMQLPHSLLQYLDPSKSLFNPANIGFKFYVYGLFPVVLNKLLAIIALSDTYNGFTIQGRALSAVSDLFTLLFVYKTLMLFKKHLRIPDEIALLGAFFYAVAVLPIQLSHFFAVDLFLNCFLFGSMYFLLKYYYEHRIFNLLASACLFALASASKVSAIYILPLYLTFFLLLSLKEHFYPFPIPQKLLPKKKIYKTAGKLIGVLLFFFLTTYVVLRLADPYYFADGNFLHPKPNPHFVGNIKELESFNNIGFPPSVQWIHKLPIIFSLYNLAFFGVGLLFFAFLVYGVYQIIKQHRSIELFTILLWTILFFLYQSTQFVKTMRYFIVLYPFFALFAAFGLYYFTRSFGRAMQIICLLLLLIWPLSYVSIYLHTTTRVAASAWIEQNVSQSNFLLNEHWDDPLPLPLTPKSYAGEELPVFFPDTPDKWTKMNALLAKGNYLILSSNRGWGSIPTVPERYPQMTQFYKNLFAGKLQYKKVAEFTSYPSLSYLGIPITFPDYWAEESFTVYDHPKVMIFKRN